MNQPLYLEVIKYSVALVLGIHHRFLRAKRDQRLVDFVSKLRVACLGHVHIEKLHANSIMSEQFERAVRVS